MKIGTIVLLLAVVTAPACGGGGGGDTGTGGSPGPVSASFIADQPSPGANTVAMLQSSHTNDIVNVFVTLTGTPNVFGTAFEVVFDETNAAYLGYTKGAAFEQNGNVPNYTVDGTSNPGRIVIAVARTNGTVTTIVGSKAILTLQLRVKHAGTFPVAIQNGVVYDGQSTPQPIPGMSWFAGALQGV
jgi:hypothetical protein